MTEKNVDMKEDNTVEKDLTEEQQKILTPSKLIIRKFKKRRSSVIALIILCVIILSVIFAPVISKHDPYEYDFARAKQPPSKEHILGTDELGRDYFARILYGGRVALQVGIFAVLIEVVIGCIVGGIAGYYGGWIDNVLMRATEIFMSFPFLPLVITISAIVGTSIAPEKRCT